LTERLKDRKTFFSLTAIAGTIYIAALIYGQFYPETRLTLDSYEYLSAGRNLLQHGVVYCRNLNEQIDPIAYSRRPPAYPFFILPLASLSSSYFWIAAAQIFLTFLSSLILIKLEDALYPEMSPTAIPAALLLLYPAQIIYSQMVMAEILLQFFLLLALYTFVRFVQRKEIGPLLLFNVLIGLSALTKPVMMFFWLPNIALHLWLSIKVRRWSLLALPLIPILAITAWSYRNERITGYFHFTSMLSSQAMLLDDDITSAEAGGQEDYAAKSRAISRAFFEEKLRRWPETVRQQLKGAFFLFLDPGRFDIYQFLGREHDIRIPKILQTGFSQIPDQLMKIPFGILLYLITVGILNLLFLFGFFLLVFDKAVRIEVRIMVILLIAYLTVVIGPLGFSRYRLAFEPYLILGIPALLTFLSRKRISRRGS
jgi:4-amino-4-deoxy-L-arabinose transferase-like glycosyltransferase